MLFSFSGCAKIKGERIEFGHLYRCPTLRGKVYYITFREDAAVIRTLKEEGESTRCYNPDPRYCAGHGDLCKALRPYNEGFFGWF
jgi:hypothetical protein